eukprot:3348897-Rhodomonas_salina.2
MGTPCHPDSQDVLRCGRLKDRKVPTISKVPRCEDRDIVGIVIDEFVRCPRPGSVSLRIRANDP